ncbi:Protein of unknown function [Roseivivax halotolerans]|uniref:Mu-like prophage protein gp16 n=1 Tax=Roseivivax halotolerans TaxID=93684 RepID=A0A1I5W2G8_9RHOB|nr:regulatory protein GemA [Roseivivax halotolerans]SFQ13935.1 Protein of unknown function [Roseivivax halotolerans]
MTRALQKTIHVGCRELGLNAEARHDLQLLVTGKASLRDMNETELKAVVSALKDRGFKLSAGTGRKPRAKRADIRYIHVLWSLLGNAGKLTRPGRDGLNAFLRSRFEGKWQSVPIDVDALREPAQINAVIRALRDWCHREGIDTEQ